MKTPKPHQAEAIKKIAKAFRSEPRVTVTMACGSGKTLVGLWAAETLKASRILVIMPSLPLIRQTLREWRTEAQWPRKSFLCVCSDPSVSIEEDELAFAPEDLDFPVTTEASQLKAFLKDRQGIKIVFSTYMSSSVLANGTRGTRGFDIGIFDEAHKTAGKKSRLFSLALSDKNVPIRRRLFMTATPRHYNVQKSKAAYSMDNPKVYGPIAYNLIRRSYPATNHLRLQSNHLCGHRKRDEG